MKMFRIIAFLEGLSFILLVGIAMPLKHIYGHEGATQEVGMAHGVLFMAYVVFLYIQREKHNWNLKTSALLFVASLLPFGTFVADYKFLRKV